MRNIVLALVLSAIGILCGSCKRGKKPSAADFPGTYVAKFSHGTETLLLKPEGAYEQKYTPNSGSVTETNFGNWAFHASPHPIIYLENALLFDTRSNQPQIPPTRTVLALQIKTWSKEVELVINDEESLGYLKQPLPQPSGIQK